MREERGLTLIELLLALALAGLVAAAIGGIYYTAVRAWQRNVEMMDCRQNVRIAVDYIDRELRFADWVTIPQENEIRYKLKGDLEHDNLHYYRRFRLQGEQLLVEEIRNKKNYSYNVVAMGLQELHFSLDPRGNVYIAITAGETGGTVTMQSSVCPRNVPKTETP